MDATGLAFGGHRWQNYSFREENESTKKGKKMASGKKVEAGYIGEYFWEPETGAARKCEIRDRILGKLIPNVKKMTQND